MPIHRDGKIAMVERRHETQVKLSNGHAYHFKARKGVNLAWVLEEDEDEISRIKRGCCGGTTRQFVYASEGELAAWERGL